MSLGQNKLNAMNKIVLSGEISEYIGNKKAYASASKSFLRQLLKDIDEYLTLSDSKLSFNPGGPAVPGDPSLYVMADNGKGVAVYISVPFIGRDNVIMYRAITSMKDHSGTGNNNWLDANTPYGTVVDKIAALAL